MTGDRVRSQGEGGGMTAVDSAPAGARRCRWAEGSGGEEGGGTRREAVMGPTMADTATTATTASGSGTTSFTLASEYSIRIPRRDDRARARARGRALGRNRGEEREDDVEDDKEGRGSMGGTGYYAGATTTGGPGAGQLVQQRTEELSKAVREKWGQGELHPNKFAWSRVRFALVTRMGVVSYVFTHLALTHRSSLALCIVLVK